MVVGWGGVGGGGGDWWAAGWWAVGVQAGEMGTPPARAAMENGFQSHVSHFTLCHCLPSCQSVAHQERLRNTLAAPGFVCSVYLLMPYGY